MTKQRRRSRKNLVFTVLHVYLIDRVPLLRLLFSRRCVPFLWFSWRAPLCSLLRRLIIWRSLMMEVSIPRSHSPLSVRLHVFLRARVCVVLALLPLVEILKGTTRIYAGGAVQRDSFHPCALSSLAPRPLCLPRLVFAVVARVVVVALSTALVF